MEPGLGLPGSVDAMTGPTSFNLGPAGWRAVVDAAAVMIAVVDLEGRYISINPAGARMFGIDESGLIGMSVPDVTPSEDYRAELNLLDALVAGRIDHFDLEKHYLRGDGTVWLGQLAATLVRDQDGHPECSVAIVVDITAQREAEEARSRSDRRFRPVFEQAPVAMALGDANQRYVRVNQKFCDLLGYTEEQLLTMHMADITHPDDAERTVELARGLLAGEYPGYTTEKRYLRATGEMIWTELTASILYEVDGETYGFGTWVDITARKAAEVAVANLTQALRTLAAGSAAVVRASDETELCSEMCRVVVEEGGYLHAWVMVPSDDALGGRVAASAGIAPEHLEATLEAIAALPDHPFELTRLDTVFCRQDIGALPDSVPWKSAVLAAGARSIVGLPLRSDEVVYGLLGIGADRAGAFDSAALRLLEELAQDFTYGITARRVDVDRIRYLKLVEESLDTTIEMMATVVEMRDPYTAGHARGVARLAVAIATELGLEPADVHEIRLAATIHDIGKMGVPTDLLVLPRRLTPTEFELVKDHPQLGHDILRGVRFPSRELAAMVLQHHERLDGSGYPAGLAGTEILVGARIIAVADVVNAMASHRPYRSALGLDAGLAEIEEHRGVLYDPDVVDACLRLFREQRFAFDEAG